MIPVSPKRRLPVTIALLVALIVLGALVSHSRGPAPDAGRTYTGTVVVQTRSGAVRQRLAVSFAVSANGRRVSALRLPDGLPSTCTATQLHGVTLSPGSAAIVSPSTFRLALALTRGGSPAPSSSASGGDRVGTLLVSGVFHTFGRESGAVSTQFGAASLRVCGTGGGYTAKAAS